MASPLQQALALSHRNALGPEFDPALFSDNRPLLDALRAAGTLPRQNIAGQYDVGGGIGLRDVLGAMSSDPQITAGARLAAEVAPGSGNILAAQRIPTMYEAFKNAQNPIARTLRGAELGLEGLGAVGDFVPGLAMAGAAGAGLFGMMARNTDQLPPLANALRGQRGIIGSTGAKTADLDALEAAKRMKADGVDADNIHASTGWWLDHPDGRPRFEIDDSGTKLLHPNNSDFVEAERVRLSDLLYSKKEGKRRAYEAAQGGFQGNAGYDPVDVQGLLAANRQNKAFDQEIQQIQSELDNVYSIPDRQMTTGEAISSEGVFTNYPELQNNPLTFDGRPESSLAGTEIRLGAGATPDVGLHELQHAIQSREGMARGGSPDGMVSFDPSLDPNIARAMAYDQYNRLAGESEARLVQQRMNLTPAERAANPFYREFDVPLEDQIVRMEDGTMQALPTASQTWYRGGKVGKKDGVTFFVDNKEAADNWAGDTGQVFESRLKAQKTYDFDADQLGLHDKYKMAGPGEAGWSMDGPLADLKRGGFDSYTWTEWAGDVPEKNIAVFNNADILPIDTASRMQRADLPIVYRGEGAKQTEGGNFFSPTKAYAEKWGKVGGGDYRVTEYQVKNPFDATNADNIRQVLGSDSVIAKEIDDGRLIVGGVSEDIQDLFDAEVAKIESLGYDSIKMEGFDSPTEYFVFKPQPLPTDTASRMQRAREGGFDFDLYHGTGDDIYEFDLDHPNRKDTGWLGTGVYGTSDPALASTYASMKGKPNWVGGPQVLPLKARMENPYYATIKDKQRLQLISQSKGKEAGRKAADEWTQSLKDKGHDGVILQYKAEEVGAANVSEEYVIFDPASVRSRFAQFDPAKRNSADLLAGGVGGLALANEERRKELSKALQGISKP